jgi:glycoside hydrolase-like protein
MRLVLSLCALLAAGFIVGHGAAAQKSSSTARDGSNSVTTFLGFDSNDYPGDAALPQLAKTFAFAGYWLNVPPGEEPGEAVNGWKGKRAILLQNGFGFLVLFNGRWEHELKSVENARTLGATDAKAAAEAAREEGFARGAVIFVDQEEGGTMSDAQLAYLLEWFDGVDKAGFRAGVYCSGMKANEGGGHFTITAEDIRKRDEGRKVEFFVYNDGCPPAPGCVYGDHAPPPSESGVEFAVAWQYAQSPQRPQFTKSCRASYQPGGNCYPPAALALGQLQIDLDSATSADPSHGRQ